VPVAVSETEARHRLLLLAGSTEARELAEALLVDPGIQLIVSLAGRTSRPASGYGEVRTGGFGGREGLARYLHSQQIALVVDATHPFAATMPVHAADACARAGIPLLKLTRPAWTAVAGDRWTEVDTLQEGAALLVERGARRVLLTTGRQELDPFRHLCGPTFFVRSIEPPDLHGFQKAQTVLARGPFDVDGELALLRALSIDVLVTKNSGGHATAAKLEAARVLGVEVVMVRRPPLPPVMLVESVGDGRRWISDQLARLDTSEA
jgi:precorrin-6A/cobalt-precorrin-6A reductase